MGEQLNLIGIDVIRTTVVPDNKQAILDALHEASNRAKIILITGGLGPTKDDITKHTLCEFFNCKLVRHEETLKHIENYFTQRGRQILETNRQQADVPEISKVLKNIHGTAPGMWFEKNNCIYVSMPGVPYEMKYIMHEHVLPVLKNKFVNETILHRTILTQGIGESFLAEIIKEWENNLRNNNLTLAYLPSPGIVRLRISAKGNNEQQLQDKLKHFENELIKLIPQYIYGYEKDKLEEIVGKLLLDRKQTLSTAESCTGGYIAHLITSVAGSSNYYLGSVISYDNSVKINQLAVNINDIKEHGAVSKQVVEQMATGVKKIIQTDYSIAVSGIAGPEGGTPDKPVGTVWIAIATNMGVFSKKFLFEQNRERNIQRTALTALNLLRKIILQGSL
jgi:nicotinamide-nucleotide amidase